MTNFKTVRLEVDQRGIATLTLCRPEKHNALSAAMLVEITEAATALAADDQVRVVVMAGAGRSFCAGADLDWMRAQFAADRAQRIAEARRFAAMLERLNTLPKPLVGRVQGPAFGGGIGLMAVCDAVVAAEDARFALTEVRLGIIPATISPYVVARIGEGAARRAFMSGRMFGADEACDIGLVTRVVTAEEMDAAIEAEVSPYFAAAPGAVAAAKALARRLEPAIDRALIEDTIGRLADAWESAEAQEGIAAFFDRHKPGWAR